MLWTAERTERVKKLWMDGLTAGEIANAIGHVSRNAVIGRMYRLGLRRSLSIVTVRRPKKKRVRPSRAKRPAPVRPPVILQQDTAYPAIVSRMDAETSPRVVSLLEAEPHHCRWPVQGGFCGCSKLTGLSYCAGHAARAFTRVSAERVDEILEAMARTVPMFDPTRGVREFLGPETATPG